MILYIENKLTNALIDCGTFESIKSHISGILKDIAEYKKSDNTMNNMHTAFKALEDYNTQYVTAVADYHATDVTDNMKLVIKVQKILCLATMAAAVISTVLRRYSTSQDTGTIAKYLRMLNEQKEYFKNEKIMWQSVLKSLTGLVAESTQDKALKNKELEFKIRTST